MPTKSSHKSRKVTAEKVRNITDQFFEPGRQDRCHLWVYREKIRPLFEISESTFWRYINETESPQKQVEDPNQLKLFD